MRFFLINDTDKLIGGAEVVFHTQSHLLRDAGHEVFTFCFSSAFWKDSNNLRLPTCKNWWVSKLFKLTLHPRAYWYLRSFICRVNPEAIIIHNIALYPLTILLACRGYPTVHVTHDFYLVCPRYGAVQKSTLDICGGGIGLKCIRECYMNPIELLFFYGPLFLLRRIIFKKVVSTCIAPTKNLTKYLQRFGYPAKVLPNPVPFFNDNCTLSSINYSTQPCDNFKNNPYLLYVGALSDHKGVDCLIKALAIIHNEYPSLRIKLAGDGPSRRSLEDLVRTLGVQNSIEFLGPVPRNHLCKLYDSALALVVPSYCYQENFPTVIIEAMVLGCTVIGSNRGGIPEMLGQNERGLLFRPGDPEDLANKILFLLRSPGLKCELITRAKSYAVNKLNPQKYIYNLIEVICNILIEDRGNVKREEP